MNVKEKLAVLVAVQNTLHVATERSFTTDEQYEAITKLIEQEFGENKREEFLNLLVGLHDSISAELMAGATA